MSPEDKGRVRKAFMDALDKHPDISDFVHPGVLIDEKPVTLRSMIETTVESESLYQGIDEDVAAGRTTIDKYVDGVEAILFRAPVP